MNIEFNNISVIGLGYIGLCTAAIFASRGIKVLGVDINTNTVEMINAGNTHIIEPDLDILVNDVVRSGYLRAEKAPQPADAFIITVPTPFKNKIEPDLSYVLAAVQSISPVIKKGDLIILESTSPLGTTHGISIQLATLRHDLIFPHQDADFADIAIAYCPERVMPGQILRELLDNDRMIGGLTATCNKKAKALYKIFVKGECVLTNAKTAEMTKLTENAYRDVNIAFANELSLICDKVNVNVWELIKYANRHPRVSILQPGPGVGGHCIAIDPWFLIHAAPMEAKLMRTARKINDTKPLYIVDKIKSAAKELANPIIAFLGLTYKPNSDDLRESPALIILDKLVKTTNFRINIVEPHIKKLPNKFANNKKISLVSLEIALDQSVIIVSLVAHQAFCHFLDKKKLKEKLFINVSNLEDHQIIPASNRFRTDMRPVSEYGLIMMNKIYGHIP